jgi:hypothetical protein
MFVLNAQKYLACNALTGRYMRCWTNHFMKLKQKKLYICILLGNKFLTEIPYILRCCFQLLCLKWIVQHRLQWNRRTSSKISAFFVIYYYTEALDIMPFFCLLFRPLSFRGDWWGAVARQASAFASSLLRLRQNLQMCLPMCVSGVCTLDRVIKLLF